MRTKLLIVLSISVAALTGGGALAAQLNTRAYVGQDLAGKAHVSIAKARLIALKAHPGHIKDQELEKEAGGSGLRYSFDIVSGGKTFEVGVDALNGAVLENKAEGRNPD